MLLTAISEEAALRRDELAPAIPRVWHDAIGEMSADLVRWLQATRESGWQPILFEHPFGRAEDQAGATASKASAPVRLSFGLPLQGVIDAVEQSGNSLRATDYKTGAPPETSVIVGGWAAAATHAVFAGLGATVSGARSDGRQRLLLHDQGPIPAQ